MGMKTDDAMWLWIILTALLFPTTENRALEMTKNEQDNLEMFIKEIGDSKRLRENEDGNDK